MFCPRCGLNVEEGNRFCRACGQEFGATAASAHPSAIAPQQPPALGIPGSVALPYAGFWERFAAHLIDSLILGIPFMLVFIVMIFLLGGFGLMTRRNPAEGHVAAAVVGPLVLGLIFLFAILSWLYFAGMESSERQATFGKAVMSLRVTDLDGQRTSFGHSTGRFFAKILSGMVPLAIGYIMAAFTARKQALHDIIAGTLVLKRGT